MTTLVFSICAGLLIGVLTTVLTLAWARRRERRWAEEEAFQMVEGAKLDAAALQEELDIQLADAREDAFEKFEKEMRRVVSRIDQFEEDLDDRERIAKEASGAKESGLARRAQQLNSRQQRVSAIEARVNQLRDRAREMQERLLEEARKRTNVEPEALKAQIQSQLEQRTRTAITKVAQEIESEAQVNVERDAKKVLGLVLNRFARPYCPERGIGNVTFNNADHKNKVFGPNDTYKSKIEQVCGVDIVYNADYQSATIMGFDPVRRELGRLVLEAVSNQKRVDEKLIDSIHDKCKKDLFKRILVDGNRVANELRLSGMHESVRSMLGALRYRYSFAQNQHFHCAEVGWLCGLLSAELGVPTSDGRRAGVLHDIGKAMDHSKDGGHAVIGAEFIEGLGENEHIVHAVRAHHYDEQPSTDLAFLTIAADAISGARPGARRSTMDSYTQKMADLEKIGSSFHGVTATYILSAGREIRVIVDGHKVDDHKALSLSKQIAQRIEEELSYPGLIKVTVVRETQAVEFAR